MNPRDFRIAGFAVVDFLAVALAAKGLQYVYDLPFVVYIIVLLIIGIITHKLLNIDTRLNRLILGDPEPAEHPGFAFKYNNV